MPIASEHSCSRRLSWLKAPRPTALRSIAPRGNNWRNCIDRCTYWDDKTTKNMGKVKVPTTSVERLLAEHPDVHMVKIDIEGAEMELLETVTEPARVPMPI